MSERNPNEVLIAPELLEQFLSQGGSRVLNVKNGPAPEAKIIGVEWRTVWGHSQVVLAYDRKVPEPVMTHEAGLEQQLTDLRAEVENLCDALLRDGGTYFEDRSGGGYISADSIPLIAAILRETPPGDLTQE